MNEQRTIIKLWDLPIRIFHWSLAMSVSFMLYSGYTGDFMERHLQIGPIVIALVVFRILWGIVGSTPARFATFIQSPRSALTHAREFFARKLPVEAGHNALGGYVVIAMLSLTLLQAVSGLFMTDDIFLEGPLYASVSEDVSGTMSWIHGYNYWFLGGLIVLHPLAIAAYALWGKQNLLSPMITGKLSWPTAQGAPAFTFPSPVRAIVVTLIAAAAVFGTLKLLT